MRKMQAIILFGSFLMAILIFTGCSTGGLNLIIELEEWEDVTLNGKKGSKRIYKFEIPDCEGWNTPELMGGIRNRRLDIEEVEYYPIENVLNAEYYIKKGSLPTLNDY